MFEYMCKGRETISWALKKYFIINTVVTPVRLNYGVFVSLCPFKKSFSYNVYPSQASYMLLLLETILLPIEFVPMKGLLSYTEL